MSIVWPGGAQVPRKCVRRELIELETLKKTRTSKGEGQAFARGDGDVILDAEEKDWEKKDRGKKEGKNQQKKKNQISKHALRGVNLIETTTD